MKLNFRIALLVLITLISFWYILSPVAFKKSGVVVVTIEPESQCGVLSVGDRISRVWTSPINNLQEFETAISKAEKGQRITMLVNFGPGGCLALEDGYIGVTVSDIGDDFMKFGLDVYGGSRVKLDINSGVSNSVDFDEVKTLIEDRSDVIGSHETRVVLEGGDIYIDTIDLDNVPLLLAKGSLQGRLDQYIRLSEGRGQIKLGSDYYDVRLKSETVMEEVEMVSEGNVTTDTNETGNRTSTIETVEKTVLLTSSVIVDGKEYGVGETFNFDQVDFELLNITNETLYLGARIFENDELSPLEGGNSYIRYEPSLGEYQFFVPVELREGVGQRFAKVTDGMSTIFLGETSILEGTLAIIVDGREINRLTLPSSLAGEEMSTMSLVGSGKTLPDALNKKALIEVALSGDTEYTMKVGEVSEYVSGNVWMLYIMFGTMVMVAFFMLLLPKIIFKGLKIGKLPLLGTILVLCFSFNVIGTAALTQRLFEPGWVVDQVSILGIILSVIWTGGRLLLASELSIKKRDRSVKTYVDATLLAIAFVSLFTEFNGFGIPIIYAMVLNYSLLIPMYKNSASKV